MRVLGMAVTTAVLQLILDATIALSGSALMDTWYVRPQTECAINGNGLSYACAEEADGPGAFNSPMPTAVNWTSVTGVDQGDVLYICGFHTEPLLIGTAATGTAERHITIRFDCPGNPGRILQQTIHAEALQAGNWVNESTGVWYLSFASYENGPKRVWVNGNELVRSETKQALGQSDGPGHPIRGWWYQDSARRLYYPSMVNPATIITELRTLASGNTNCAFSAICFTRITNQYFDVINPNVEGGNFGSIYILGAANIRIFGLQKPEDCRIGRLSNRGIHLTDTLGWGAGIASANNEVFNCILDPGIPESFDGYTHEWNGVSHDGLFLLHGSNNNKFHHLVLRNWQHAGIGMAALNGPATINGNVIEHNTFECEWFIEYCRAFVVDGTQAGWADGNIIRQNIIDGMTIRSQFNGTHNTAEDNLFMNQRIGDIVIERPHSSQILELQPYRGPSHDNVIRRNVFYNNTSSPCISFRDGAASTIVNTLIEDNTFINCGGIDTPGAEHVVINIPNAASILNQTIRNNRFFVSNGQPAIFYKTHGFLSVADFETNCVGDVCTGNRSYDTSGLVADESVNYTNRCGFGMWWRMDSATEQKHVCFH